MIRSINKFRESNQELKDSLNKINLTCRDINESSQLLDIMYNYEEQISDIVLFNKDYTFDINLFQEESK